MCLYYTDEDLVITIWDFMIAGSDTTSNSIRWYLYYLAKHQQIQTKMRKMIDSVVPRDRLPTMEDKAK